MFHFVVGNCVFLVLFLFFFLLFFSLQTFTLPHFSFALQEERVVGFFACLLWVGFSGFFVVVWLFVFCIYLLFLQILLLTKFKTVQCLGSLQGHFMYLDP